MAVDFKNLTGSVDVYELQIVLGVPSVDSTSGFQTIVIPYTGIGDPSDSAVSISRAWYSLDAGSTWSVMTKEDGWSGDTGLTFSPSGTSLTYRWAGKTDLGVSNMYNTVVKIAFKASGTKGDSLQTTRNMYIPRTVVDQRTSTSTAVYLPSDYAGVAGYELLENAPKTQ